MVKRRVVLPRSSSDENATILREVVTVLTPFYNPMDWQPFPFSATWANYSPGTAPAQYRVSPEGRVQLRGYIYRASGASAVAGQLPVGARPRYIEEFPAASTAFTTVTVSPNGELQANGALAWVCLSGITFEAEQP